MPERLVPLEGTLNFRDLGGYRAADGRTVRWGRVYRSDGLGRLTDADHDQLLSLGIRTICDLRGPSEPEREPSRLPEGAFRVHHLPMRPSRPGQKTLDQRIRDREIDAVTNDDVVGLYLQMLEDHPESVGGVLRVVADTDAHAVVFHCAAGKDRTGMTAAILLSLLGVDDEQILHDYELTNRYRTEHRLHELQAELEPLGIELEPFRDLFVPQRRTLARTLDALRARHGGLEAWVVEEAGVDEHLLAELRELLLEP